MTKILEVKGLEISFDTYAEKVRAIRGVNFHLNKGETLTIVGESESGKLVTVRSITRLLSSNANTDAEQILLKGRDIVEKTEREMQKVRGRGVTVIFQNPMTFLDPAMPIGKQVAKSLRKHNKVPKKERQKAALELFELAGIPKTEKRINSHPHQFSRGQRQRIVIAIALICYPEILIADRPATALDVTVRTQILELLKGIQIKTDTSVVFITHDLGVVTDVADRVAIMCGGRIIEVRTSEEVFYNPQHPCTWGLLGSIPTLDGANGRLYAIPDSPPDLLNPPKGDAFYPRNEFAMRINAEQEPPFFELLRARKAATWLLAPQAPGVTPPGEIRRRWVIFKEKQEHTYSQG